MQVVSGGKSLWIYTLLFTYLQLWGRLSASTSPDTLPAPELSLYFRSEGSAALVCRAPEGHHGILFMLYRFKKKVDSRELHVSSKEVNFTVMLGEEDSVQPELYCCLYKNQEGFYSAFSPYLQLERKIDGEPTHSAPSLPPPVLSVQPSTGIVKHGGLLSFSCSLPPSLPQSQHPSNYNNKPSLTFLLLWTAERTRDTSTVLQPPASQVSGSELQPGFFSVGPAREGDGGEYTCLYQITNNRGWFNSTVSNKVKITIADPLPVPTLVLQQQTEVWHLLCTGSPAYPGAVFSLYLADGELPIKTQHVTVIHHQATFPVPVQDTLVAVYQCQYKVLLGREWSNSERSLPLAVTRGAPPLSPDDSGIDWPLVLGSFSAGVLFLTSVIVVAVVVHRKVKAAAKEKKRRQDAKFWTEVHSKDHIVDLPLRHTSFNSQEMVEDTATENSSRSLLWNSLSTFTSPIHPVH